jgi:hypothetical protein
VTLDFTLDKYAELCETIRHLDCPVMTVRDFLKAGQPGGLRVILRHDVDRRMSAALRMAELESRYDIAATYYVRTTRAVFKPAALRHLHALGHEVGYHYEVLAKANGNMERAIALFQEELHRFREIVPVETVSMHGSPLSRWNNLDLWETHNIWDYGLCGEIYLGIDYSEMFYFTDTGRSWYDGKYNLRDRVESKKSPRKVVDTDDLIAFLRQNVNNPILINVHPNRWASNYGTWLRGNLLDWLTNQAKVLVIWHRNISGKE